jgi:hypothetical protein
MVSFLPYFDVAFLLRMVYILFTASAGRAETEGTTMTSSTEEFAIAYTIATEPDEAPGYFDFGDGPLWADEAPDYTLICAERCSPSQDCYNDCMNDLDPEGHLANIRARQEAQHREEMYRVGVRQYVGMVTPFEPDGSGCPF